MKKRIHWAWVILIVSFITILTNISIRFSYGILMPEMITSLKITKTQAGVIASSFYLAYTIFSPLLGFLIDRVSARKLLTLFSFILELPKSLPPPQLAEKAYGLYEKFRPEIPPGKKGWGASGKLDLDLIRKMASA
jgi:MFS family permease